MNTSVLGPISRDTLTERAADTIKRFILTENLQAGMQLPSERELSQVLVVSRNILREALSALATEGVVTRYRGKGTFVCAFDRQRVAQSLEGGSGPGEVPAAAVLEARVALEIGALEFIVRRITDEEIESLATIVDRHEHRQQQNKSGIREDIDFHLALLKSARNPLLMNTIPLISHTFRTMLMTHPDILGRAEEGAIAEHRAIIEALRRRDLAEARRGLWIHLMKDPIDACQAEA